MDLGPMEIGLILLAFLMLFGYKKLPDASRSLGRSLRIFKSEVKGLKADDAAPGVVSDELSRTDGASAGTTPSGDASVFHG